MDIHPHPTKLGGYPSGSIHIQVFYITGTSDEVPNMITKLATFGHLWNIELEITVAEILARTAGWIFRACKSDIRSDIVLSFTSNTSAGVQSTALTFRIWAGSAVLPLFWTHSPDNVALRRPCTIDLGLAG